MSNYYDETRGWIIEGQSLEEYRNANRPVSDEELQELGIIDIQEKKQEEENALQQADQFFDYDTRPNGAEYEKLNAWDTTVDIAKAVGTEALHILQPKDYETQYVERTHFAENLKYMYRYGMGTLGLGKLGAVLKGVQTAGKATTFLNKAGLLLNHNISSKFKTKTGQVLASGLDDIGAGIAASFALRRPEDMEGQMMDMLGDTGNPIISALQSNANDTELQERTKGVINDTLTGLAVAPVLGAILSPLAKRLANSASKIYKGKKVDVEQGLKEIDVASTEMDNVLEGDALIQKVRETITKAQEENIDDIERYLLDSGFVNGENEERILEIYNILQKGKEPIPLPDGRITTKVNSWRDAADVSPEELARQTEGDGVELMENSVRDTWKERGWLAENEEIVTKTETPEGVKSTPNTKATNRIVKQYTDKWQMDNNVKVEWVDGQVNGADGNTSTTSYKGTKKNGDIHPNIVITINKNCDNPYAVLRSELEHARDIAKREVPNQKEQHFSRYKGMNESEMSLEYVKKKADTRIASNKTKENIANLDNKYDFEEVKADVKDFDPEEQPMDKMVVKSKDGQELGHIKYTMDILPDTIFIGDMENYKIETGVGRSAIAKLMAMFPNKKVEWIAISKKSTKSYNEFCKEYPDLVERVNFKEDLRYIPEEDDIQEILDSVFDTNYNSEKGVIDGKGSNQSQNGSGSSRSLGKQSSSNPKQEVYEPNNEGLEGTENNILSREMDSDISSTDERGKTTSNSNRPISERIIEAKDDLNSIDKIVAEVAENDVEISGTDWTALAKDADGLYAKLKDICGTNLLALKKAFANNDVNLVNAITRKALAAERMVSDLVEQVKVLAKEGKDIVDIVEAIHYLSDYASKIGSGYGRGLNELKFINKIRSFLQLTTLEKQGLNSLVDILHTDLISLNFTRSTKELKQEMYSKLQNYFSGQLWNQLMQDPAMAKAFDKYLTDLIVNKDTSPEVIEKALRKLVTQTYADKANVFFKWADSTGKIMENMRKNLKLVNPYYISNLLSSPVTQFKNIISGASNSLYFPFKKIVAGFCNDGGVDLTKEGILTYQNLLANYDTWKEAWHFAKKVMINGEGTLVNLSRDDNPLTSDSAIEHFFDFHNLLSSNPKEILANIITFGCRLMGASDELITQLNYRSIVKAKAYMTAERGADALGLTGDKKAQYIQEVSTDFFNKAFDVDGKAMDVEAYAEARDIVLQTPVSGTYHDYTTGQTVQMKEQTVTMQVAQGLQMYIEKCPPLKIFFPFVRTGANIMQQNLEHNLLYGLCSPSQSKLLNSKTREGALARAQLATGIASFGVATSLVMQGGITGAEPSDPQTREALLKTGWKPYSIRLGNTYVSYQGYEPLQSMLGFAADAFTIQQAYEIDGINSENIGQYAMMGAKSFVNNFLDKATFRNSVSQLQTIFDLIESDDTDKIGKSLAKQARGFLPLVSLGNYIGSNIDSAQTKPQGFYDTLFNKYFQEGRGDYRRNIWGERQDLYNCIINSGSDVDDSIENQELQRLAQEYGWSPSEINAKDSKYKYDYREFKGTNYKRSLHDMFLQTQSTITLDGLTLREAVAELVSSDDYQTLLDGVDIEDMGINDTKINRLKAIFKRYREAAKEEVLREYGDDFISKNGRTAKEEQQFIREAQEMELLDAGLMDDVEDLRSFN